jgi:hypothetical protein
MAECLDPDMRQVLVNQGVLFYTIIVEEFDDILDSV